MTGNHTPAPWRIIAIPGEGAHIADANNRPICKFGYISREDQANARLIVAAPETLEALRSVLRLVDSVGSEHMVNSATLMAARATIAKAEGRS
jgi:hypothetical protein